MLVRLYDIPELAPLQKKMNASDIIIRRPRAYEKFQVIDWVTSNFSVGWASECDVCFSHMPITAFIATQHGNIVGFSCYESTHKAFFGPVGVLENYRGLELGKALLLTSLHAMSNMGYAYAIIGGPTTAIDFYRKAVSAIPIEKGSSSSIYIDRLNGADS